MSFAGFQSEALLAQRISQTNVSRKGIDLGFDMFDVFAVVELR